MPMFRDGLSLDLLNILDPFQTFQFQISWAGGFGKWPSRAVWMGLMATIWLFLRSWRGTRVELRERFRFFQALFEFERCRFI